MKFLLLTAFMHIMITSKGVAMNTYMFTHSATWEGNESLSG